MRSPKNLLPISISLLALAVAGTGTAVAATNSVTIADSTTPTRLAKVDTSGRLLTSTSGAVTVTGKVAQAAPAAPVSRSVEAATGASVALTAPSTATLAVSTITFANLGPDVLNAQMAQRSMSSGQTACAGGTTTAKLTVVVPAGATVSVPMTSPLVIAPASGGTTCLSLVAAGATDSSLFVSYTGYVVSGTYTPPAT